jgi:hypothetical protein
MEMEKEAQHLKAAKARSTCKECVEHNHVQEFRWQGDGGRKLYTWSVHRDEDARRKWDNLPGARWVTKKNIRDNSKVPRRQRLLKLIRERWRITLRRPSRSQPKTGVWDAEPLHEGSCCIRQDQMTKPACEDQKKWLSQSGYPRLQRPQRALIRSNQVKKSSHGL